MRAKGLLGVLVVAILLVAVAHVFFLMLVTIPGDGMEPTLLRGDRAVVNRWSYGLRSPVISLTGYRRYLPHPMVQGDWVAFNAPDTLPTLRPDTGKVCVGRCIALPGDTVWMGTHGKVSPNPEAGRFWPVAVPKSGDSVAIHPWNARLYALTISRHEGRNAIMKGSSLYVEGKKVESYCFQSDYYWLSTDNDLNLGDSRTMGFIPESHIIGRLMMVLYSLEGWKPRWNRTFSPCL